MSVFRAARTLGQLSGWSLTNLSLQKTLYIAQMIHLARYDRPLFNEQFEAWDFGPAVHALHSFVKRFGRAPVEDIFDIDVYDGSSTEAEAISEAWEIARSMTAGQLVTYTHRPGGAWEQVYDAERRSVVIPQDFIKREWDMSARASDDAVDWASAVAAEIEAAPSRYVDFTDERSFRERVRAQHIH